MIRLLLKILSVFFIFGFPVGYIFWRFRGESEEVIVHGFGLLPTLLIIGILGIGLFFVLSLIKAQIINDPTGSVAIGFYGIIMLAFGIMIWAIVTWVIRSAEQTYEIFIANMKLYRETAYVIMGSVFMGLGLLGLNIFIGIKK